MEEDRSGIGGSLDRVGEVRDGGTVTVSRDDIAALNEALSSGAVPAPDLLRALVDAIAVAADSFGEVTLDVDIEPLSELFEASFEPAPSDQVASAGPRVRVRVAKIGR